MNEEIKLIIKAVVDDAKKGLEKVKKELNNIEKTGEKSGKSLKESMAAVAKGAAIATAAITAVVAAMVNLGKRAAEVQKEFSKLDSSFQAAGGSAEQARATYESLYRFLGDTGKATEASQQLAKITTNTEDLAEWTKSLQGVYATFGDSLPIESLAEAANETIKVGKITGTFADALNWAGVSEDAFNEALAKTNSEAEREALIRQTLNSLYSNAANIYERNNSAMMKYNESQVKVDSAIAQLSTYLVPLLTELNEVAAVLLTALKPAFEVVAAVIIVFCQWITAAIQYIGSFFGLFSDEGAKATKQVADTIEKIKRDSSKIGIKEDIEGAEDEAKKLKKSLMGFDELNVLTPEEDNSGNDLDKDNDNNNGLNFEIPDMSSLELNLPSMDDFQATVDKVKEKMEGLLVVAGLIGVAIGAWKLTSFIAGITKALKLIKIGKADGATFTQQLFGKKAQEHIDGIKEKMTALAGQILTIGGAIAYAAGFMDAWAYGVDWKNLALMITGAAMATAGLYMQFGTLGAGIGVVAAGVGLIILGVKDFIENGATLESTILIIGGAIAIAVGLATAGVSVLISAIVAVVAAVAAFTAGLILEEKAIKSRKEAQDALNEAIEVAIQAENNYISAVDSAESALNRLKEAEEAAGMTGAELYKQVQDGVIDYANMTAEQKELYKAYLDNEQKQKDLEESTKNLEEAKKAETIASWENQLALAKESGNYDEFKKSVVAAFESSELSADEARELIEKSMSEMSTASQQTFMEDLPNNLKDGMNPDEYETTAKKLGDWFSGIGSDIASFFVDGIWNPIKKWWNETVITWFNQKVKPKFTKEYWVGIFKKIKEGLVGVWDTIKTWFGDNVKPKFTAEYWLEKFDAIKNGAKDAFNGVIGTVEKAVNFIIRKINTLSWDIPDWVPIIGGGKFGFDFNEISIPRLATGGIVNSSILANIGEDGYKEAVLPLERNTEWMNILADKIAERNSTPSRIVLMLDGKELGYATIGSINNITKQTGSLPLVLV